MGDVVACAAVTLLFPSLPLTVSMYKGLAWWSGIGHNMITLVNKRVAAQGKGFGIEEMLSERWTQLHRTLVATKIPFVKG